MNVLQLGVEDWSQKYQIPKQLEWQFNRYPSKKIDRYQVVLVTGPIQLTDKQWNDLRWKVNPYDVYYMPETDHVLSQAGQLFLKSRAARLVTEKPAVFLEHLPNRNYFGQTGGRVMPQNFVFNRQICHRIHFIDAGHVDVDCDTDDWAVLAHMRNSPFVDPGRRLQLLLEYETSDLDVRFRVMDLSRMPKFYLSKGNQIDHPFVVPTPIQDSPQFIGVAIEVRGHGKIQLGNFHYRWWRDGAGAFLAGGHLLVNHKQHRDLAYLFSPGDLRPPLQVYFGGYHEKESFEAFPLFNNMHTPFILFSDNRLIGGSFYIDDGFNQQVKRVIRDCLHQLGFNHHQLITTGISMGTYPAIRYGTELQAHAVVAAKPLLNLGYIARRGRLQRPGEFQTSYDMLKHFTGSTADESLIKYDHRFWQHFKQNQFSDTSYYFAYMKNDDYDNHATSKFEDLNQVKPARQLVARGYAGRHNDNNHAMITNFMRWLHMIHVNDFGREE